MLATGAIRFLDAPEPGCWRSCGKARGRGSPCVFNLGREPVTVSLPDLAGAEVLETGLRGEIEGETVVLPGHGGLVAVLR